MLIGIVGILVVVIIILIYGLLKASTDYDQRVDDKEQEMFLHQYRQINSKH